MKRIVRLAMAGGVALAFSGSAVLADGPGPRRAAAPAPAAAAPFSWSGAYVGGNIGAAWLDAGNASTTGTDAASQAALNGCVAAGICRTSIGSDTNTGVIGGLQVGYNWQMSNIVLGVEVDIQGSTASADGFGDFRVVGNPIATQQVYNANLAWLSTVRGRIGALISPTMMAYFTGGFAFGEVQRSFGINQFTIATGASTAQAFGRSSSVDTGWTIGGGLEWLLGGKVTVGAEYLYVALDSGDSLVSQRTIGGCVGNCNFRVRSEDLDAHIARLKVNFKF